MNRLGKVAIALMALWGCSPRLPVNFPSEPAPVEASNLVPESMPVVPVLDAYDSGNFFATFIPDGGVLSSQAELDAFLSRFSRYFPPGFTVAPPLPDPLRNFDFTKYRAIAVSTVASDVELARIVGVEDRGERWVVHTARWKPAAPPHAGGFLHIVGVPRSDKSFTFLSPVETTLVPGQDPQWKAIANPEITRDTIEALMRSRYPESTIEAVSVEKRTLQAARELLRQPIPAYFSPESEVWVTRITGDLFFNAMPGTTQTRFPALTLVLTPDTAVPLAIAAQ